MSAPLPPQGSTPADTCQHEWKLMLIEQFIDLDGIYRQDFTYQCRHCGKEISEVLLEHNTAQERKP